MTPRRRSGAIWGLLLALGVAAVFRVPAFLSTRHLGYDDGVYLSSVLLMRHGLDPFSDFFSSQGPFFLPFLRAFDMTGIGGLRAARLGMVVTGALLALAVYLVTRSESSPLRSAAAALVAASSGVLLMAAGPVQSDGVALALSLGSLAAVLGDHERRPWLSSLSGALLGLGMATKHANLIPITIVIVTLLVRRGRMRPLAQFLFAGLAAGAVVTVAWDPAEVWEQYVLFHLSKHRDLAFLDNAAELLRTLIGGEMPLLALGIAGLGFRFLVPTKTVEPQTGPPLSNRLLGVWLGATVFMDLLVTPIELGFGRFAAFLIPPLILAVLRTPIPSRFAVALALVAIPYQWLHLPTGVVQPTDTETTAIEALSRIPEDSYVVTDDQGLVWAAGRLVHPTLVDTSYARIQTHSLTVLEVQRAAADKATCAFLADSGRFTALRVPGSPPGYLPVPYPGGVLAIRPSCV